jgi:hypothetical protein
MEENKVQFQKGLSVTAFLGRFGTEERRAGSLKRWCWPCGFVRLRTRALQCRHCHHQSSITAWTIFEATKLPLRTQFFGGPLKRGTLRRTNLAGGGRYFRMSRTSRTAACMTALRM